MGHTHFCEVCSQPTAICDGSCQQDEKHYCSAHHPQEEFHIVDKPTVRMTVRVEPDAGHAQKPEN